MSDRLRLTTANLLHGVAPRSGAPDADALRAAYGLVDADVLALQEVDRHQPRSGGVDQAGLAADVLGAADVRFVATVRGTPGRRKDWSPLPVPAVPLPVAPVGPEYGVALVSRLPVLRWASIGLPGAPLGLPLVVPGPKGRPVVVPVADEPRAALAAVVETAAGPLSVITAHLSFVPGWNAWQLRRVVAWARAELPGPRVLLGDLNLPTSLAAAASGWQRLTREASWPAAAPRVSLDGVLGDRVGAGGWRVASSCSHALPVGDHAALSVELVRALPPSHG
ncbi:endonuclease/exonuclease/phosphatase family metal-dependent hydrolase [Motilibacter rhizosphaerae]|uniref:Endonuclease/exonuclease/phosphatase family metal-dependent hydrolase n=1 Tax=Motilibacter rhizosphaerae TaxID=598652 RepID=A0A4Q7NRD9_9ACTN|nr:endonuclease/exonuclease/phosphatase family protein [Motilibacter rhizosphaerae]RZS87200.1 endonuclease/exonuclease/phosphatase family metal-dependent hydrolase [Motilibacter rhizosphaerae]